MLQQFKGFLTQSNALALAVGVIIGAATSKLVSAVVEDLLMPVIGLLMPAGDWREAQIILSKSTDAAGQVTLNAVKYGHFLGIAVDFFIISFVVFLIIRPLLPRDLVPHTRSCPECLETIPQSARRCKACGSSLVPEPAGVDA